MPLDVRNLGPAALEIEASGKLEKCDYEELAPVIEGRLRTAGRIGLLIHVSDLEGWTPSALWEDLKLDVKHFRDVSRVAIVADESDKRWMATVSKPFTAAEVEFFAASDANKARTWVTHNPTDR